jgi:hypothetical protein
VDFHTFLTLPRFAKLQVHVYDVVEHGRRFFSVLVFSSNSDACLASFEARAMQVPGSRRSNVTMALGEPMPVRT